MKFRSRLFGVLALISLAWICYGVYASTTAFSQTVSTVPTPAAQSNLTDEDRAALRTAGAGIGAGLGLTFFLCSGLPFFALFALLSWRNSAGSRKEQMHQEQLNALRNVGNNPAP